MINIGQNSVLGDNVVYLSQLNDVGLLQTLHCVKLTVLLLLGKHYPSE